MVNYLRSRAVADKRIKAWGQRAMLRRATMNDRECWALEVDLTANEKRALKNFTNRIFIISAVDLEVPPNKEDSLVLRVGPIELPPLRQVTPVKPLSPGGVVVYWELQVE